MLKKIPDTFHIGAISALVLSVLAWLLISRTESFIVASALKDYLAFPRLYFIVFALQLVFTHNDGQFANNILPVDGCLVFLFLHCLYFI